MSFGAYTLCAAERSDLDAMFAIELDAFAYPWTRRMIAQEFDHPWSHQWLVRAGEEAVAHVIVWIVADEMTVLDIAVASAHRRQGLGRMMLAHCFELAQSRGVVRCTLELRKKNLAALALYRELGFEPIGERPRYYSGDGEDALVMERLL